MAMILPDEDLQIIIREALNEDINTRDCDLEAIKTWLKQQPHLPDTWDDTGLLNFLRGCNFSLEKAKKKIDLYFTMRAALPEFFTNRDITRPEMQTMAEVFNFVYLPRLSADGRRIGIAGYAQDTDHVDLASLIKGLCMAGDIRLVSEKYGITGVVYIMDGKIPVVRNFLQMSPILIRKFFLGVVKSYPVKVKAVHVVNCDSFVNIIFNTLKPLLKEKLRNRVHFHDSIDALYDFVPREILPEEYGGSAGKMAELKELWVKKMEEFGPWFKKEEGVKADESKRVGGVLDCDELFGMEGSFRQLTID